MSAAPSAPATRAALRANALRFLIDQGLRDENPSLSPSTIVSVGPNFLVIEFPASEFICSDGSISREKLEVEAHCVSKASVVMMLSDTTNGTGRQINFCAHFFVMPVATEKFQICGKFVRFGTYLFQLEFTSRVKRDGVWIEVAEGTSSLYFEPAPQLVRPPSERRRNRRGKKASKRAPVVQPVAPDAPSTSDVMVTASSVVDLPTAPTAKN